MDAEEAKKVYEQSLQEEHARMVAAIQSEFDVEGDEPETITKARKKILELVPTAVDKIKYLILHADSEAVQANMAKFVMQEALKSDYVKGETDPMTQLFNKLRANDPEPDPVPTGDDGDDGTAAE